MTIIKETAPSGRNSRVSLLNASNNVLILNAARKLSDNNPSVRKSAVLCLAAALWDDMDITPALPSLEGLLNGEDKELKELAASTLTDYALLQYRVDISQQLMHSEQQTALSTDLFVTSIIPYNQLLREKPEVSGKSFNRLSVRINSIRLPHLTPGKVIHLYYVPSSKQIGHSFKTYEIIPVNTKTSGLTAERTGEYASEIKTEEAASLILPFRSWSSSALPKRGLLIPHTPKLQIEYVPAVQICGLITFEFKTAPLILKDPGSIISFIPKELLFIMATDLCKPPGTHQIEVPLITSDYHHKPRWKVRQSVVINTLVLLATLLLFVLMPDKVSTNTNGFSDDDIIRLSVSHSPEYIIAQRPTVELLKKRDHILSKPLFLQKVNRHTQRYIDAESSVFSMIEEACREERDFIKWFNALNDERQKGFILFVRARALSGFLGEMVIFNEEQWLTGISDKIKELTTEYLDKIGIENVRSEFNEICLTAENQRTIFLENNRWLRPFLNGNYSDFETGLFYFFAEHQFNDADILNKSLLFSELKEKLTRITVPIIFDRGKNQRISPKLSVPDDQIKEIVATSVFTELFYSIPADFITLISAYESNFSMEYWKGGYGTTQQTIKGANTVLQSKFWINGVYESSGVKIRMQMVPLSALDNVFLCITEAGKTIAVKAAELNIKTSDIGTSRTVLFDGQLMPASWAIAYKYNGSQDNAKSYADGIHSYFNRRINWLQAFHTSIAGKYSFN